MIDNSLSFPYISDFLDERGEIHILFLYVNIQSVLDSFRVFLECEAYKKNAVFFSDHRSTSLRQAILSLMGDYENLFATNNMCGIEAGLYEEVLKEANATIPIVNSLKKLQERALSVIEEPECIKKFYTSSRYQKMCLKMNLVTQEAIDYVHSANSSNSQSNLKGCSFKSSDLLFPQECCFSALILDTFVSGEPPKDFIVYMIQVTVSSKNLEDSWTMYRRFRDFCELHDVLIAKFPHISNYNFPEKRIFGNKTPEFIEKRKATLSQFFKSLLESEALRTNKQFFDIVSSFLRKERYDLSNYYRAERSEATYANLSDGSQGGGDNLDAADVMDFADKNHLDSTYSRLSLKELDNEEIEQLALSIIVSLIEEMFDVRNKTPWLARQIKSFVKDIFIAAVGDRLGRKIVDHVDFLFGAERITECLNRFRESFWPANTWAEASPLRSAEVKSRQKIVSCALMIGLMPTELRRFLGDEVALDGINRLFNLLQIKVLNKRLMYSLLETIIGEIFPENSFIETFKSLNEYYSTL